MAIYDINTIQGDVNTSYGDEYIKQALANLGQRQGLKGDAIQTQTFKISDVIFDSTNTIVPKLYIKGYYDATKDVITYTADSDDIATPLMTYALSDTVEGLELTNLYTLSSENVNLSGTYRGCKITKHKSTNSYYFIGQGIDHEETTSIVVLEFNENGINLLDGLYFEQVETDKIIMMHYNGASQIEYTGVSLSNIYSTLKEYSSIDDILNQYVNNNVTLDDNSIIEEEHNDNVLTVFNYIASVLIPEIKTLYNDSIYKIDGNGYLGLKRRIIYELIKHIYVEFNKIDSKTDTGITVYFGKDFYISYIANTNTNVIYLSYDISFRGRGINNAKIEPEFDYKNDANIFLADINTEEDRYASYKFYINYIDDDKYVDSITIDQTAILPYIDKNDDKKDVWYINGERTNINATGKDAGNPNIMFISYTMNESADADKNNVEINILHTYTDENVTLEILNTALQTPTERVMQKFYYDLGSSVNVANSIDKNYEFEIALPEPNKLAARTGFENFIKNVLIFAIVDTKISTTIIDGETLHSAISGQTGSSTYLTVFFHISKTTDGKYEWVPILNPLYSDDTAVSSSGAPVLDLSAMTSLSTLMNYYVRVAFNPDVYYHRWVVFESTNETLKNTYAQASINSETKYPVIKVDTSATYYGVESKNNLNFTPKFVAENSIIEDNGKINQINDTSVDNASFAINEDGTISDVVGVVKVTNDNKNTITQKEWIPNAKVDQNAGINDSYPMLDLREVFVNNQTLLNRLSIITTAGDPLDNSRYPIYHAYIGHRYDSENEGIDSLVIGSESKVYNMQNSTTMGRDNSWQNFKTFNNLIFALPTVSEEDAKFNKNVSLVGTDAKFDVNTKETVFTNSELFKVSSPSIIIEQPSDEDQESDNYLKFENGKISIISPDLELNNRSGIVNINGSQISNNAETITLNGRNVSIDTATASINTTNGFNITNTPGDNKKQQISFNENDITVSIKGSTTGESEIKLEYGKISLPENITTSIIGGDSSAGNFIKYNPDSLEISSNDLKLNGNITTSGGNLIIDSGTTINKPINITDNITATGTAIELGSSNTVLTLTGSSTKFNTGDTTFSGNIGVHGNVTATNVTVNGLLVTKTSSVSSVLTYPDGSNWDYPYGPGYNTPLIKKMFLFGLTTIDLNYVCNGEFKTSNSEFITIDEHTINTSRQTNKNTRKFIDNYSYSDITLNLTAFLNAYTDDSMFARTALYRENAPGGTKELVTEISDVKIRLANPTLYKIEQGAIGGGVNIPDEHRLKTFLLFIERFAFFANPTEDYSTKDVYVLRQAKEISMTMDNFNPDMVNHVCILEDPIIN